MVYPVVLLEDYGDEPVTYPKAVFGFGDKKPLRVVFVSKKGSDLTGATATCTIYNSAGTSIATPAVTVTISATPGKYRAACEAVVDASASPFTLAGGSYTAAIELTSGSYKRAVRIPLDVQAVP